MSKAEELGKKGESNLTEDEWNYVMTMGHSEYREYSLAKSRDRGYIRHLKDTRQLGETDVDNDGPTD